MPGELRHVDVNGGKAGTQADERADPLAEPRIGHADHPDVGDGLVVGEGELDERDAGMTLEAAIAAESEARAGGTPFRSIEAVWRRKGALQRKAAA